MQAVMPALGKLCLSMKEARLSKQESKKLPLVKDVCYGGFVYFFFSEKLSLPCFFSWLLFLDLSKFCILKDVSQNSNFRKLGNPKSATHSICHGHSCCG